MAELHVQPKKNNSWWIWLLLAIIIIGAAIYYYVNYYQKGKTIGEATNTDTSYTSDTATTDSSNSGMGKSNLWDQVDFNSPDTVFPEITDKNITIQSNPHFVIYSLNAQSLFADNQSELSNEGKQRLDQVGTSINNRFNTADVKIYDQSDTANAAQLSEQRAQVVSDYLVINSKLDRSRVSIHQQVQEGSLPVTTNRVAIVVKR